MFVFDTNIIIFFLKRKYPALELRIQAAFDERLPIYLPAIVYQELEVGVLNSRSPVTRREKMERIMDRVFGVLSYDADDARLAAEIHAGLLRQGKKIGAYDLLIAAQVLRRDATLVTHNYDEFSRVPGLKWEDWTLG